MSYTWGPEQPQRDIRIDGKRFLVRENCHYAIQQARQHDSSRQVWVDSICINQDDLQEKSAQVGFMGDIYAKAATVLACVGPGDEASDAIAARLRKTSETFGPEPLHADRYSVPDSPTELRELYKIWNEFCARPYFHRVWIAQELFEGWGRTVVLCGRASLPWAMILTFCQKLQRSGGHYPTTGMANMTRLGTYMGRTLTETLAWSADLLCADARDRIYGIVRLVDWEMSGVTRPAPDYTLSVVQLLIKLSIRGEAVDVATFQSLATAMCLSDSDFAGPSDETPDWIGNINDAQVIRLRDGGRLFVDHKPTTDGPEEDVADPGIKLLFEGHEPVQIFGSDGVIALACPETRPGDILLETRPFHVVVRPSTQPHWYNLVGRAKISEANCYPLGPDYEPPIYSRSPGNLGKQGVAYATIRFRARVQDVLYQVGRSAETYEGDPGKRRVMDIPIAGSMLEDVTLKEYEREFGRSHKIRPPLPGCPKHT